MSVRDLTPMPAVEQIEIRRLGVAEVRAQLDRLAAVLVDCVEGGASVSYMAPFTREQARREFAGWAEEVERGRRPLLAAYSNGDLVGTVQVVFAWPPNQPHRAEIAKLLVHRSVRRRGIAQRPKTETPTSRKGATSPRTFRAPGSSNSPAPTIRGGHRTETRSWTRSRSS
jgi:hypothetical protein